MPPVVGAPPEPPVGVEPPVLPAAPGVPPVCTAPPVPEGDPPFAVTLPPVPLVPSRPGSVPLSSAHAVTSAALVSTTTDAPRRTGPLTKTLLRVIGEQWHHVGISVTHLHTFSPLCIDTVAAHLPCSQGAIFDQEAGDKIVPQAGEGRRHIDAPKPDCEGAASHRHPKTGAHPQGACQWRITLPWRRRTSGKSRATSERSFDDRGANAAPTSVHGLGSLKRPMPGTNRPVRDAHSRYGAPCVRTRYGSSTKRT